MEHNENFAYPQQNIVLVSLPHPNKITSLREQYPWSKTVLEPLSNDAQDIEKYLRWTIEEHLLEHNSEWALGSYLVLQRKTSLKFIGKEYVRWWD
jgi:hypothetical protein